jgi:hypothetical protein
LTFVVLAGSLYAQSVYRWTDENGVVHYSNTGIPDEVVEADVRPEESSPAPAAEAGDESAGTDQDPRVGPEGSDTDEPPPGKGKPTEDRLAAKAERERKWLQSEIKRVNGLSIGKSFTPGMKDAQLRPLQERLALLSADPERYFRMKRQGAFDTSSPSSTFSDVDKATPSNPLGGKLSGDPASSSAGGSTAPDDTSKKEDSGEKPSDGAQESKNDSGRARFGGSATTLYPED